MTRKPKRTRLATNQCPEAGYVVTRDGKTVRGFLPNHGRPSKIDWDAVVEDLLKALGG